MNDNPQTIETSQLPAAATAKPFSLSVKVLIRDGAGRCLLIRRSAASRTNPGRWELPGGKVDVGERFDQALLREISEETALAVALQRVAGCAESELPERRVAYLVMEASLEGGEVRLSSEHDAFVWARLADLAALDVVEQFRPFVGIQKS